MTKEEIIKEIENLGWRLFKEVNDSLIYEIEFLDTKYHLIIVDDKEENDKSYYFTVKPNRENLDIYLEDPYECDTIIETYKNIKICFNTLREQLEYPFSELEKLGYKEIA